MCLSSWRRSDSRMQTAAGGLIFFLSIIFVCFLKEYVSGDEENPPGTRSRRHSSPGESRSGSATALHQTDYPDSVSPLPAFSYIRTFVIQKRKLCQCVNLNYFVIWKYFFHLFHCIPSLIYLLIIIISINDLKLLNQLLFFILYER